jgi:hypothetical protein
MSNHWIEDDEGHGVYERVDGQTAMRDVMLAGIYEPVGQVPELSSLLAPLLDTEEKSGLVAVKDTVRPAAVAALETMKFVQVSAQGVDPIEGNATYVLGEFGGSGWVTGMVNQGYMVMVQLASVNTGSPILAATKAPVTIVQRCQRNKGWAMVAGPAQLAIDAMAIAMGQVAPACPAGTIWNPQSVSCVPAQLPPPNGGGEQVQPVPAEEKKTPSWVLPVAIGGGALLIAGLLVIGQRRPARPRPMTPNKSRSNRTRADQFRKKQRMASLRNLKKARTALRRKRAGK